MLYRKKTSQMVNLWDKMYHEYARGLVKLNPMTEAVSRKKVDFLVH